MLKTFTREEMLLYWKRRLGLRVSAKPQVENSEVDQRLMDEIDIWYDDLLATAPADKLPVEDVSGDSAVRYIDENSARIDYPSRGVRLVALRMRDWKADEVESVSPYSDVARLQRNRLTRATTDEPVVVSKLDCLEAHGLEGPASVAVPDESEMPAAAPRPIIDKLLMVVRPEEGTYVLDRSLFKGQTLAIH